MSACIVPLKSLSAFRALVVTILVAKLIVSLVFVVSVYLLHRVMVLSIFPCELSLVLSLHSAFGSFSNVVFLGKKLETRAVLCVSFHFGHGAGVFH